VTTGVVLTGGRSARMGTDKALVELDGVAMAVRVAAALRAGGCDPVWCQGGDEPALGAVGLEVRPDPEPHAGPLAAIEAALLAAAGHDVVVAACDLPDLDGGIIRSLVRTGRERGALVAAAADGAGAHLIAWWSPDARVPLRDVRADGVRSYREALERLAAVSVPVAPDRMRNVNTPSDLDRPAGP
jgi:molybdopterin-guanine dinucleotide biosynthesis protein A